MLAVCWRCQGGSSSARRTRTQSVASATSTSSPMRIQRWEVQAHGDLPKTSFGLRANSVVQEPELQKLWEENQVLKRVYERNTGATFVLHDGPPYANGDLHMGHALDKILKDIINRYKLLQNHKVSFIPVLKSMDKEALNALTPIKLRQKAAKFAKATSYIYYTNEVFQGSLFYLLLSVPIIYRNNGIASNLIYLFHMNECGALPLPELGHPYLVGIFRA
ncbi:hypothetical protein ABZP36_004591 [Zizania latifolia]